MAIDPVVITIETKDETDFNKISQKIRGLNDPLSKADVQFKKTGTSFGGMLNLIKSSPVAMAAAGVGIGAAAAEVVKFGASSLKAAGEINNLLRGLEFIEGSSTLAKKRLGELYELAKNPALDQKSLVQYDAILKNIGATSEQNNTTFIGLSRSVSTFGGNMHDVNGILHQYQQAADKGKILTNDFRPIIERTRGSFLSAAREVHGFTGGLESMQENFKASGQSFFQYFDPIWKKMGELPGAELNSYTNLVGNLDDAFNQLQAAVGQKLLPTFQKWGSGLIELIEKTTNFVNGVDSAKESVNTFNTALKEADTVLSRRDAIQNRITDLQAFITETENSGKSLERNLGRGRTKLTSLGEELRDAKEEVTALSGVLTGSADSIKFFNQKLSEQETELQGVQSEMSKLETQIDGRTGRSVQHLTSALNKLKTEESELTAEIKNTKTILEGSKPAYTAAETATDTLKVSAENLKTETKALIKSTKDLIPVLKSVSMSSNSYAEALDNVHSKISAIVQPITDADRELQLLHSHNNAFGDDLADVAIKIDDVRAEVVDLEISLGNVKSPMDKVEESTENTKEAFDHAEESMSDFKDTARTTADVELPDIDKALKEVEKTADDMDFDPIKTELEGLAEDVIPIAESIADTLSSIASEDGDVHKAFQDLAVDIAAHFLPGGTILKAFWEMMDEFLNIEGTMKSAIQGPNEHQGFRLPGESEEAFQLRMARLAAMPGFAAQNVIDTDHHGAPTSQGRAAGSSTDKTRREQGEGGVTTKTHTPQTSSDLNLGEVKTFKRLNTQRRAYLTMLGHNPDNYVYDPDTKHFIPKAGPEGSGGNLPIIPEPSNYDALSTYGVPTTSTTTSTATQEEQTGSQQPKSDLVDVAAIEQDPLKPTEPEPVTPPGEVYRKSTSDKQGLQSFEQALKQADKDFNTLTEKHAINDVLDKYDTYSIANQAYLNKEIELINKSHITAAAKKYAISTARFNWKIRQDAMNLKLPRYFDLVGRILVSEIESGAGHIDRSTLQMRLKPPPSPPQSKDADVKYKTSTSPSVESTTDTGEKGIKGDTEKPTEESIESGKKGVKGDTETFDDIRGFKNQTARQKAISEIEAYAASDNFHLPTFKRMVSRLLRPVFAQDYASMRGKHTSRYGSGDASIAAFESRYGRQGQYVSGQLGSVVSRYAPESKPAAEEIAELVKDNPLLKEIDKLVDALEDNTDKLEENKASIQRQLDERKSDIRESFGERRADRQRGLKRNLQDTFFQGGLSITQGGYGGSGSRIGSAEELQALIQQEMATGNMSAQGIIGGLNLGFRNEGGIWSQGVQQQGTNMLFDMVQGQLRADEDAATEEQRAIDEAEKDAERAEAAAEMQASKMVEALAEGFGNEVAANTGEGGPIVSALNQVVTAIGNIQIPPPTMSGLMANLNTATEGGSGGGDALFHFKETDRMAQDVGGDIARAMFSPSDTQRKNARDFSDNVRGGALREIARMRGGGQGKQVINLEVPVITKIGDKETRQVTKRQLEIDQQGSNYSVPIL